MGSYEHLIVERHGPVGWLINNRRPSMDSAQTVEFFRETAAKLMLALPDPEQGGSIEALRSLLNLPGQHNQTVAAP